MAEIEAFDNARPLNQLGPAELSVRKGAPQVAGASQSLAAGAVLDNVMNPAKEILQQIKQDPAAYGFDPGVDDATILAAIGDVKAEIATDQDGKYQVESYVHSTGTAPNVKHEVKLRAVMKYSFELQRRDNRQSMNCDMKAWRYTSEPAIARNPTDVETIMAGPADQIREARLNHMERALALLEADARAFEAGMQTGDAQAQALRTEMVGRDALDSSVKFDSNQHDHVLIKHEFKGAVAGLPPVAFPVEQIAKRHFGQMMAEAKAEREKAQQEGKAAPEIEPRRITFQNPQHAETGERLRSLARDIVDGQDLGRGFGGGAKTWINERKDALEQAAGNWGELGSHLNTAVKLSERMETLRKEEVVEAYVQLKTAPPAADAQEAAQALAFASAVSKPGAREKLDEYLKCSEQVRERLDSPGMQKLRAASAGMRGEGPMISAVKQQVGDNARAALKKLDELNQDGGLDAAMRRLASCPRVLGQAPDEVVPSDQITQVANREMEQMDDLTNELAHDELDCMENRANWVAAQAELSGKVHDSLASHYNSSIDRAATSDLAKDQLRARSATGQATDTPVTWADVTGLVNAEMGGQLGAHWTPEFADAVIDAYVSAVQTSNLPNIDFGIYFLDDQAVQGALTSPGAGIDVMRGVLRKLEVAGDPAALNQCKEFIDQAVVATVFGPGTVVDPDNVRAATNAISPRFQLAQAFSSAVASAPSEDNALIKAVYELSSGGTSEAAREALIAPLQDGLLLGDPYNNPDEYTREGQTALRGLWNSHPDCKQAWSEQTQEAASEQLADINGILFGGYDAARITSITDEAAQYVVGNLHNRMLEQLAQDPQNDARSLQQLHDADPGAFQAAFKGMVGTPGQPKPDTELQATLGLQLLADIANADQDNPDQAIRDALADNRQAQRALEWACDYVCDWVAWDQFGEGSQGLGDAFRANKEAIGEAIASMAIDGRLTQLPNRLA